MKLTAFYSQIDAIFPKVNLRKIDCVEAFEMFWTREKLEESWKICRAWLILGLINGLILGLINGLKTNIQTRVIPNQGIKASLKHGLILGTIFLVLFNGIGFGLPYLLIYLPLPDSVNPQIIDMILEMTSACSGSLLVWQWITESGFDPAMKHFALRLVLCRNGFMPWNYARFLNFCTEKLLLQRVGGRYRFIHKLVQDYFAEN